MDTNFQKYFIFPFDDIGLAKSSIELGIKLSMRIIPLPIYYGAKECYLLKN